MKLDDDALARARQVLSERARPLECALYRHALEGAATDPVLEALVPYANADGGFGHGLEPDLLLPASNVLATVHGLRLLREIGAPANQPLVSGALGWLLEARDPALDAWRSVPKEAEDHPHAFHWNWALHEDGTRWPVGILPRAEIVAHLHHWPEHVPPELIGRQTRLLVLALEAADEAIGSDALAFCEAVVRTEGVAGSARDAIHREMRRIGNAMVCRDPEKWGGYVATPLKLAPTPDSVLAEDLGADIERNLDWEIASQSPDGSWSPTWSWQDTYPEAWPEAERAWRGILTLEKLESLRAWGRL